MSGAHAGMNGVGGSGEGDSKDPGTKGENILLSLDSVRCRVTSNGHSGTLIVSDVGCSWKDSIGALKLSCPFSKIKSQRVSPAGKSKVQLQLILYGEKEEPVTFHFTNPGGTEKQTQERDTVKELLQQLLPKFKPKVSDDLAQKQKILSENRELYSLYQDLVTTGVITADEFWENHAKKPGQDSGNQKEQRVGISPGFLANVTQMDGCNGLKYNLTLDVIHSIFKTYPAVERKHLELVPHEMTDKEFWEKFFQSQYFYRDRATTLNPKDIFTDCTRQDESDMNSQVERERATERLDLTRIMEEPPASSFEDLDAGPKSNRNNAALLRRFNYHSSRVLKACLGEEAPSTSHTASTTIGASLPQTSHDTHTPSSRKRKLISTECSDLIVERRKEGAPLTLSGPDSFHKGAAERDATTCVTRANDLHAQDVVRWKELWTSVAGHLSHKKEHQGLSSSVAAQVLTEISGKLEGAGPSGSHDAYSKEICEEIRIGYLACSELLRHFWCCFPPKSPDLEKKLQRMMETLGKFEMHKLLPLEQKLGFLQGSNQAVVLHLRSMITAAYDKYKSWEEKRSLK